jgi:hypothetical protein
VGAGVGAGAGVGEGVGVGLEGVGAGVLFFFFGLGGFFCAGSEPDGENETSCGVAATWTGLTADGAAAFFELPPAFAIPNAAPNATSAATAPMAMSFPGVIRMSSWVSRSWG